MLAPFSVDLGIYGVWQIERVAMTVGELGELTAKDLRIILTRQRVAEPLPIPEIGSTVYLDDMITEAFAVSGAFACADASVAFDAQADEYREHVTLLGYLPLLSTYTDQAIFRMRKTVRSLRETV